MAETQCEFCIARAQATCHQCSRSACYLHSRYTQDQGVVCYECFRPRPRGCQEAGSAEEEARKIEDENRVETESTQTLGMQRGQCTDICQSEETGAANPEVVSPCRRQCCLRPGHEGDHRCYQCWNERLNKGCRATAIARHSAAEQGGANAALNNEAQEGRESARQIARAVSYTHLTLPTNREV